MLLKAEIGAPIGDFSVKIVVYRPHPPAWILPLSARASMPPGGTDIPAKGGTADYGWIGWTRGHQGPTITIWEDSKPPVL